MDIEALAGTKTARVIFANPQEHATLAAHSPGRSLERFDLYMNIAASVILGAHGSKFPLWRNNPEAVIPNKHLEHALGSLSSRYMGAPFGEDPLNPLNEAEDEVFATLSEYFARADRLRALQ
jgi:hypothetical protein